MDLIVNKHTPQVLKDVRVIRQQAKTNQGPLMYLEQRLPGQWRLIYNTALADSLDDLTCIRVIRTEDPVKRELVFEGIGLTVSLSIVTGIKIPAFRFELDQTPDGQWRLCYSTEFLPDIETLESIEVSHG